MKKLFVIVVIFLLLIGLVTIAGYTMLNKTIKQGQDKGFYVGVTYCGNSTQEAKTLIDKVKDHTNIFILQSATLQWNITAMEEIGDYAITLNLNYAISGGTGNTIGLNNWLNEAKERWGEHFIGIYYNDEPGGTMLDGRVGLEKNVIHEGGSAYSITDRLVKEAGGTVVFSEGDKIRYYYKPDGKITVENYSNNRMEEITYYPDGTITLNDWANNMFYTMANGTEYLSQIQTYEQVLKQNPIQDYAAAAKVFVNKHKEALENQYFNKAELEDSIVVFTSDYGLYWWDYQSGYDVVLAQAGWNNSITQEIALVRGAANLHGKSWGTIITWKYTQAPYLTDGEEMFEQMKTSYEAGAEYVIVFNYSEDPSNPNTLQEEHYQALERFWNDVVQNPKIKHGSIKANAVLVLPENYGWGMRHPQDNIWGIWPADNNSQTIWNQLQNKIDKHGLKLDIIYEDPNCPIVEKYSNTYHWNQK